MQSRMWGAGSGSRSRLNTREQSSLLNESGTTSLSQAQQGLAEIDQLQAERERQRLEAAQAAWQAMYDWVTTTQDKLVQTEDVYDNGQQRTPEQIADDRAKLTAQMEALPGLQAGLDAHREYYDDDSWSTMMGYIDMVTQGNQDVQSGLAFSDTDWQGYQSLLDRMSQKNVTGVEVYNPYWFYKSQAQGQEALQKLDYTSYLDSMTNATNETWMATTDLDALEDQLANEKQTLSNLQVNAAGNPILTKPANYLSLYGGASTNQTDNPIRLETNTDITSPVTIALQNPLQKQVGKNQQEVADQTAVVNKLESDIQAIKDYRNNRYTEMIADVDGKISVVKGKLDDVTQKIINYQNEQADGLYIPRLDQEPPETPYDDQIDKLREEYQTLEERREGLQAGKEWNAATEEEKQAIKEYQEKFQKYFDLADQEDFEEKSRYLGPSMKDKIPLGSLGKADADTVYMYINAGEDFRKYVNSNQIMSGVPETDRLQKYAGFTNDEKAVFNYIYNTQGAEAAQNYLDDYNTDLLNRYGVEIGKHISGNSLMEALFSVDAGLNSFKNGVTGWFTDEARIDPLEIANSYVRENLDTDVGRWFYDLGNAGGNMLPTLALSAINPVAGTASVFASAGGNAYQSALRDGYSRGEAYTYGVMDGTFEAGAYYLLGKMAGSAGKLTEKAAQPLYNAVKTASQKMAVKFTFSMLGNGLEEYIQTIMQPVIRNVALGEDNEFHLFSGEALYNASLGMMTAGMISGAEMVANHITNPFSGVFGTEGKVSKQVDADGNTLGYLHWTNDGKTIDGYVQMAEAGENGMHKRATSYGDIAGYGYLDADGVVQLGKVDASTGEFITDSFDPRQRSNSTVATNTPMDMDTSMQLWNASLDAVDNQARTEMLGRELEGQYRQAELQQAAPALQSGGTRGTIEANGTLDDAAYTDMSSLEGGIPNGAEETFAGVAETVEGSDGAGENTGGDRARETTREISGGTSGDIRQRLRGVSDPSFGEKPYRTWTEEGIVTPRRGSVIESEQRVAVEYGVPSFVVTNEVFEKNHMKSPAFVAGGQIYFRENIDEAYKGKLAEHEINHVMKQVGYQPYLDFVDSVPERLNIRSEEFQKIANQVAKHTGIDPLNMTAAEQIRFFDELNATIYSHIAVNDTAMLERVRPAFVDLDAYVADIQNIHEQFKESRSVDPLLMQTALDAVDTQDQIRQWEDEFSQLNWQTELQQVAPQVQELAGQYNDANTARAFVDGYDGGLPANVYALGFNEVAALAQQGYSLADIMSNPENTYSHMLTTGQAKLAYEAGMAESETKTFGESMLGENNEGVLTETEEGDRVETGEVPSIVMPTEMEDALKQHGLSPDEFDALRLKDVSELKEHEITVLKAIRESIPAPTADTVLQKVIPAQDVEKYLNGSYTKVGGFISRYGDVSHLKTYREYYGGLRLDYPNSKYNPSTDTVLGTIEFSTPDASKIDIPYSPEMGGTETGKPPFTGNGFLKSKYGQVIPEYKADDYMELKDGSKLYTIDQYGTKTLQAVYDMDEQKFVSINKGGQ